MKEMRKARKTPIVVLTTLLVIILSVLVAFSITPAKNAEALNSTSSAVKAGNGEELWNGNSFNPIVMNDLSKKLFGTEDPVSYIKANGASDYNTYGKNSTITDATIRNTPYYVVPASIINTKVGNTTDGMIVKLDGKDWMVTSLALDNDENVVITLMMANVLGTSKFYTTASSTKGNNMYSSSSVRNYLLTDSNWSLFNSDAFASKFLVQPKNMLYQQTQKGGGRAIKTAYVLPNEAWGTIATSSWYQYQSHAWYYAQTDTYNGFSYDAWKDDYIWIPSTTEMGGDSGYAGSIWRLTGNQIKHSANNMWVRSGGSSEFNVSGALGSSGEWSVQTLTAELAVRPAIHLNFSAAELSVGTLLENPETVTTTYNGDVQTLKDAYTAKPTEMAWYNKEWYEHTGNYVTVTPETELKNAGTHWVKVEITQNWINAVNAEVDADAVKYGWTADQIATAKAARSPKFRDDPVTEDGHEESSTVRWFKFTIDPKELTVNKPSYNPETRTFTAPSFANSSELYADAPTLATRFTGAERTRRKRF